MAHVEAKVGDAAHFGKSKTILLTLRHGSHMRSWIGFEQSFAQVHSAQAPYCGPPLE